LCHELRNPLHITTSNTEFLSETKLNSEQAEFVLAIDNMSKLMTSIVNDVLGNSLNGQRRLGHAGLQF
jgi:signal transduction histidine kinase